MVHLCRTLAITAVAAYIGSCNAFASRQQKQLLQSQPVRTELTKKALDDNDSSASMPSVTSNSRRALISSSLAGILLWNNSPTQANAVRAIGGAEEDCRAAGNCLEIGELDGAIGWTWGGKDRCEATDPRCGPNGKLMDSMPSGAAVPDTMGLKISDIVTFEFGIGTRSDAEKTTIKLGLYGENSPASTKQFLDFIQYGLRTTSELAFQNGMGVESVPVALSRGGILAQIEPQKRLDIGIPSQAAAYARSKGKNKIDDFLAQPRPKAIADEETVRPRNAAGLLTIPAKGIGYGGTTLESDDEAFASSFQITAAPFEGKDLDPSQQRVIGQVLDQESMANLARLASLPTKKGFKGVIPGQNSGPPLLKVSLTGIEVESNKGS